MGIVVRVSERVWTVCPLGGDVLGKVGAGRSRARHRGNRL